MEVFTDTAFSCLQRFPPPPYASAMNNTKQQGQQEEDRKPIFSSGQVQSDGALVELILDETTNKTAFAVSRSGDISIEETVCDEIGRTVLPIPASNNLIRHRALLLPGRPEKFASIERLLTDIRAYIAKYLDLSADFNAVASAYVLFSWVHDAFNELPYARFRGEFGSGKTRALTVLGSVAYKSFFASGASTVSPIFHTLDTFRGTLILDEADFRFSDKDADIVKILNNGNVKGFPVLRQSMNIKREFDPRAFSVFGPKIIAMRQSFDDPALESRFLTEDMGQKSTRPDIPLNLPPAQEEEARHLRSQLLMYRLTRRQEVHIDPALSDESRSDRVNQILAPLLSVVGDVAVRHAIERVAARIEHEIKIDRLLSPEAGVIAMLAAEFRGERQSSVGVTTIATALAKKYGSEFERVITPRYIGEIVRKRLRIVTHKSNGVYVVPATERDKVLFIAHRYGVLDGN